MDALSEISNNVRFCITFFRKEVHEVTCIQFIPHVSDSVTHAFPLPPVLSTRSFQIPKRQPARHFCFIQGARRTLYCCAIDHLSTHGREKAYQYKHAAIKCHHPRPLTTPDHCPCPYEIIKTEHANCHHHRHLGGSLRCDHHSHHHRSHPRHRCTIHLGFEDGRLEKKREKKEVQTERRERESTHSPIIVLCSALQKQKKH